MYRPSMQELPAELIARIAKELLYDGDTHSLESASCVSAHFRAVFQETIWSRLELDDFKGRQDRKETELYAPGERLLQVLQASPVLISYIRTLTIRETQGKNWTFRDPSLPDALRLIASAGNIQTVQCSLIDSEANSPTGVPKTIGEGLSAVFSMPSLVVVEVSNVPTALLCFSGSSSIRQLFIDFDKQHPQVIFPLAPACAMPSEPQRPSIANLRIPAHCTHFVTDASSRVDVRRLEELTISQSEVSLNNRHRNTKPTTTHGMHKLLSICGPSLKELALEKDGTSPGATFNL
jgi:hypothetical protein